MLDVVRDLQGVHAGALALELQLEAVVVKAMDVLIEVDFLLSACGDGADVLKSKPLFVLTETAICPPSPTTALSSAMAVRNG